MRRLRIDQEMSQRLGACGLSRNALVRFLALLRFDLESDYQFSRVTRHPADPRYFVYYLAIADTEWTHNFAFVVDDSTSPDDLFIIDFQHQRRGGRG